MKTRNFLILAAASALALGGLSGCATPFKADVARFHSELPPPAQGQSFTVVPADPKLAGSLEFEHYADLVAKHLKSFGYVRATDPAASQLVVTLQYKVDNGQERLASTGVGPYPYYGDPFFAPYPYYGSYWRRSYMLGYYDPFLLGPGWGPGDIETYVVYHSQLKMKIDKTGGGRVFEGTANAQSTSNHLTYLVPNLIDAIFTGFPGKDGEEIKVTVAPESKAK